MFVPPDPKRQFVNRIQAKQVFLNGSQRDGHGFRFVDPGQLAASNGAASYYSWTPTPHLRFISVDTVSDGGIAGPSAEGNIDDPQFRWLESELIKARAHRELVVLFSHHGIPSLTSPVPDEAAPVCTVNDQHGHDVNPGCDIDPRSSQPVHQGDDMVALLHRYPNVISWVSGHSHVNDVQPYIAPDGKSGFWSIRTPSEVDWPQQDRLLEIFDNEDGTLSIFNTVLDHAGPSRAPADGTNASGLDETHLSGLSRTLAYNDPQDGARQCSPNPCGEGDADDRNVELLLKNPLAP
jgi:hypothetical protein